VQIDCCGIRREDGTEGGTRRTSWCNQQVYLVVGKMGGIGSKIITDYECKDLNMQRHRKCGL
jgi:hypothetical protein